VTTGGATSETSSVGQGSNSNHAGLGEHGEEGEVRATRVRPFRLIRQLIQAISDGDESLVEATVVRLSQSKRYLAPLAFTVGAFVMLFQGLRLLLSEWRLLLIQVLPAMWIWAALLDLKEHVFRGKEFRDWHGPVVLALIALMVLVSVGSFFLNAVFAFAISEKGRPQIHPAFAKAWRHLGVVAGVGFVVGLALGISVIVVPRWGVRWFALSLGVVIAVMMLTYVTIPARLVGIKPTISRRDKLAASVVAGTLGGIVCAPTYIVGRIGILLLGSSLLPLGIVLVIVGFTLQAGATGAVKAIKMSAKLVSDNPSPASDPPPSLSLTTPEQPVSVSDPTRAAPPG
jgi:hypothetical protein